MKKLSILFLSLLFCFLSSLAFAFPDYTKSTGLVTSSGKTNAYPCLLTGFTVFSTSSDTTLTIYDSSGATGTVVGQVILPTANKSVSQQFVIPVEAKIGLYYNITGTGSSAIIYWTPR
jgi:hypothetical protein